MPNEITNGVRYAIRDSVEVIYSDALRNIPVDEGDLAAALGKQIRGDKLGGQVGYWKKGNKRRWRQAGWRAHFTEFGTRGYQAGERIRSRNHKARTFVPPRKAQPFLGPAFMKNRKWIRNRINRSVDKALDKASRYGS